ncbi:outer membrane protein assembly factor BamD [Pelagibacteraceae bacterium]|jgi:outer membrane protein assembly factor BamD|nr:outer membrane protein assembly factor BamD [Candidatus Pelagibacter bacterium]MDC1079496.1 outer membrane protein assembly factor BamD [Pelagibacteraceae bacterium]
MFFRVALLIIIVFTLLSCSKNKKVLYEPTSKVDPYIIYNEAMESMNENDFYFANKKFTQAELNFKNVNLAAKAAIMSSFCLYSINFYDEAVENLNRFLKLYPADKNIIYAHYLIAIIYFEQISDEKKDLKPLLNANEKIDFFIKNYPETDYSLDLKFKKDLIQNQLAAKEAYIARYYISVQKWVPAINRLKLILEKYDETVFVEEALFRLVEIHYYLGLDDEAKSYAKILGYNYNSSEWFAKSYKILNKDYNLKKDFYTKKTKIDKKGFLNKIIDKIK